MKMPDAINPALFAPCGMDCLVCYVHLKKKKPCRGCLLDDADKPERCRSCRIKSCAREKGLAYCHQCPDDPCRAIRNLDKSYRQRYQASLTENGRTVAAAGLAAFSPRSARAGPARSAAGWSPCTTKSVRNAGVTRPGEGSEDSTPEGIRGMGTLKGLIAV
jgi:hypothetical protein